MRQAPPVALTLSGGGAWRAALVALPALAFGVLVFWLAAWLHAPRWLAPLAAALAAAWAWRRSSGLPPVHLQWTGEYWAADGAPGETDLMLDTGRWMLLRFRPQAGPARWLPVPRAEAGAVESGLRAALYARVAPGAPKQA